MLYIDIETVSDKEAEQYIIPAEAPSNYKDPEKIKAYIAEKQAEQVTRMALDPDYGKIRAIGIGSRQNDIFMGEFYTTPENDEGGVWQDYYTNQCVLTYPGNCSSEKDLLEEFWNIVAIHRQFHYVNEIFCGYNIVGFDLPFILRRSMACGVKIPFKLPVTKYNPNLVDLMLLLYPAGNYKGLKFLAKRYGLTNNCEGVDGSMVASLTEDEVIKYVMSDVNLAMQLEERMEGIYK